MSDDGADTAAPGVLEIARFDVRPGTEEEFAAAYRQVRPELLGTPGCRSARLVRLLEEPTGFTLLVEWDTVDSHLLNFRESERFVRWRAALGPYFAGQPTMVHGRDVATGPDPA
ncbi:antibiotic biosynthesis monooxygenase family protein [Frankia sp. AgKG'84/4]|uniref:antibiotic biosynthesis monooxygenase family protein n=1 Tax=Frankia sp. AgKG'84/4 TaxID=573490 RepID=UPI00200DC9F6|nr:antibiotic biosynthesis monooxygenase family protein [Frankia sp. AgKG'84/4]MCL9794840.1 antibiotic biosynthesis monooxygenase [Frankia sp. AgKG'84/4]